MVDSNQRHRIVFLGAGGVGKSSIVQRFLNDSFTAHYTKTVEDLHCREYQVMGSSVKIDILDTAGQFAFPAMRRLSIANAHGFVLVYAIDESSSFDEIQRVCEEIKEERDDFPELPCVIVGNKSDCIHGRQVDKDTVISWLYGNGLTSFLEVSAKRGENVLDIFQLLLDQAKGSYIKRLEPMIRRRLSVPIVKDTNNSDEDAQLATDTPLSRSRSLVRPVSKHKVKHNARRLETRECIIS